VTSWSYVVQSTPWIVAGLLVGFFVGRSTVAAEVIADGTQEGDDMSGKSKRRFRFTSNGVIAALLVMLGIATAVQSYVQSEATERLAVCQQAYSNGFADALDARSDATQAAQNALDDLLSSVASITPTPQGRDQFRAALTEYLDKRAAAKRAQKEHPYPPAPRDVCKDH
jgi:hypothetical protein